MKIPILHHLVIPYPGEAPRQRCTAHLQRESRDVAHKSKNELAVVLYGKFSEILSDARIYHTLNHKKIQRIAYANYLSGKINSIIEQYMDGDNVSGKIWKEVQGSTEQLGLHLYCSQKYRQLTTILKCPLEDV